MMKPDRNDASSSGSGISDQGRVRAFIFIAGGVAIIFRLFMNCYFVILLCYGCILTEGVVLRQ